ncbi:MULTISPECIES: restriction endonuclease subunit S [Providencia]|uniref:restriction endonuclease subunit S n=1 Tax=Providencia TaxID=586 RepID=UPI0012B53080|nr:MULTISPECIES: restriction endonuclease subunit S [Providencia]MTC55893.1 restriction endonuclease subunit S [Providencia rustigianii]
MSVNNKVPEIRFKGFSEEWIENNVGQLCDFIVPGRTKPQIFDGDIPWVTTPDITSNSVSKSKIGLAISMDEAKRIGSKIVPKNSIIISCVGDLGLVAKVDNELIINQQLHAFTPKENISEWFLLYELLTRKKHMENVATKTSVPYMNKDNCNSIPIIFPYFEEQIQVGNFFQKLDNLINQHQQKYDKLSNIKKAMLEKMFPKQGETVPEIRFKGFNGEWKEIELGDEVTFINGRAYSQEELKDKGKYTVLRVGNFYTNLSWYYSDMELGDKYYADYGDLLYTWSASFGPHIWNGGKVIYHYHIWKLELSENIEKLFLLHLLDYDRAKILSGSNGSTMIHITKSAMEAKKVFIPKKDEQAAIGNYFQKLDTLINQHQQQITKLNNIKQACLSKMFV